MWEFTWRRLNAHITPLGALKAWPVPVLFRVSRILASLVELTCAHNSVEAVGMGTGTGTAARYRGGAILKRGSAGNRRANIGMSAKSFANPEVKFRNQRG